MNSKRHLTSRLLLLLFLITVKPVCAQINDLERVSPESQGISSSDIEELFDEMVHSKDGEPHGIIQRLFLPTNRIRYTLLQKHLWA